MKEANPIAAIVQAHDDSLRLTPERLDAFNREVLGQIFTADTKPRRMKQPIKDELRRRLEVATAQGIVLQAQLDDALPMNTVHKLLVVAVVIGVALGRFVL